IWRAQSVRRDLASPRVGHRPPRRERSDRVRGERLLTGPRIAFARRTLSLGDGHGHAGVGWPEGVGSVGRGAGRPGAGGPEKTQISEIRTLTSEIPFLAVDRPTGPADHRPSEHQTFFPVPRTIPSTRREGSKCSTATRCIAAGVTARM